METVAAAFQGHGCLGIERLHAYHATVIFGPCRLNACLGDTVFNGGTKPLVPTEVPVLALACLAAVRDNLTTGASLEITIIFFCTVSTLL